MGTGLGTGPSVGFQSRPGIDSGSRVLETAMNRHTDKRAKQRHARERNVVHTSERLCRPFFTAGESAKARDPGEPALDDPSPRQQHETAALRGQLDHSKPSA